MQAIADFLKQHEKTLLAVTGSCLFGYLFFRKHIWSQTSQGKQENSLDVSLSQLIAQQSHPRIKKIVITASSASKGQFRKQLIDYLKQQLTEEGVKVLINCSVSDLRYSLKNYLKLGASASSKAWNLMIVTICNIMETH